MAIRCRQWAFRGARVTNGLVGGVAAKPGPSAPAKCCVASLSYTCRRAGQRRPLQRCLTTKVHCCVQGASTSTGAAETFTITTPLYYVNAVPHMGSAYPTIAADVIARFQRLHGKRVRFITGTDEHGEKIAAAAAARGMAPQEHCDAIAAEYKALWAALDIEYDHFVRTTEAEHEQLVAEVLERVWSKGDIYKAAYAGFYCVDCEEYKDESELVDLSKEGGQQHSCPTHRKPCSHRQEENYFFALSRYQEQLEALLEADAGAFVVPSSRRNEVAGWVREGARDFSISRAGCTWGIPIPQDPSQTIYVWFDALNGYLSGLAALASAEAGAGKEDSLLARALSAGWPADVHVIGKDILRFHAVYWPGMLLSAGLEPPRRVFGHGFLTKDGLKMGKALGNTLDPAALVAGYGPDAVRFYFMREVVFGQDGNFSEAAFRDAVNAALANNVGNMLQRTLSLLWKHHDGVLPCGAADLGLEHPLAQAAAERMPEAAAAYERLAPHAAAEAVMALATRANALLEEVAPWTAYKKGTDDDKVVAGRALVAVLETARLVALALYPITPRLSSGIWAQLGLGGGPALGAASWDQEAVWGKLPAKHATHEPAHLFARIDVTVPFVTEPAPAAATTKSNGAKQPKVKQPKKQPQSVAS